MSFRTVKKKESPDVKKVQTNQPYRNERIDLSNLKIAKAEGISGFIKS